MAIEPRQRAALTHALRTRDSATRARRVLEVCDAAVSEWDARGYWPDDWTRWQRALSDCGYPYTLDDLA